MSEHLKGLLITALGAIILSPDALLVRMITANEWTLLFWRGVLFSAGICLLMLLVYKTQTFKQFVAIGRRGLLISVIFACSTALFVIGLQYTNIANMLVIISSSPVFAALFGWIFLGEKVAIRTWLTMLIIMLAITAIMSNGISDGSLIGDLCALGNAILMAATITMTRHAKAINMIPAMAISGILVALFALPFTATLFVAATDVPYLLLLGSVLTIAFALLTLGPRYISSAEVSLLMPLETVFGIFLAWLVLQEAPSELAFIGGITVILSLSIHSWLSLKKR